MIDAYMEFKEEIELDRELYGTDAEIGYVGLGDLKGGEKLYVTIMGDLSNVMAMSDGRDGSKVIMETMDMNALTMAKLENTWGRYDEIIIYGDPKMFAKSAEGLKVPMEKVRNIQKSADVGGTYGGSKMEFISMVNELSKVTKKKVDQKHPVSCLNGRTFHARFTAIENGRDLREILMRKEYQDYIDAELWAMSVIDGKWDGYEWGDSSEAMMDGAESDPEL